jgi:putative peptidoglycan lipid II flippase
LVALLFALWATPAQKQVPWLQALTEVPGLHMALGMASALASYINLGLLWHWLKRAGVYERQHGWGPHLLRLAVACLPMVAVLLLGRWVWPDWTAVSTVTRVWHLAALVAAGATAYLATLFAMGFRLRELHGT